MHIVLDAIPCQLACLLTRLLLPEFPVQGFADTEPSAMLAAALRHLVVLPLRRRVAV